MDQAEGLRQLAKGGAFEQMGLPAVFDQGHVVDYAKLWNGFKDLLEGQIRSNALPGLGVFGKSVAQDILIYMIQAETAAHHIRPASDYDFASVRATLQGDSHD